MKNVIPIVMAGGELSRDSITKTYMPYRIEYAVLTDYNLPLLHNPSVIGIYGLIISVILAESIPRPNDQRLNMYSIYTGMAHVSYAVKKS